MSDRTSLEFATNFKQIQSRLHGYIFSLTRDLNDTDDLFQQTAVILWKKYEQFNSTKSFFSWACGIARFEALNFLRTRSANRLYFTDEINLQLMESFKNVNDTELELRKSALDNCKEQLRERDRDLVNQCYADQFGIHQVAKRLDRTTQSIHNSLRRIRAALFECIQRSLSQTGATGAVKPTAISGVVNHE